MDDMNSYTFPYILAALKRRLIPLLTISLVGFLATLAVVCVVRPLYKSEGRLLIQPSLIPETIWENPYGENWKTLTPRLRSRVLSRVALLDLAEAFKLYSSEPELSPGTIVKRMEQDISFTIKASGQTGQLREDDPSALELQIGFRSEDPNLAQRVASRLVDTILSADLTSQVGAAEETVRFMRGQAAMAEQELARHQHAISSFMSENRASLPTNAALLGAQVGQIERELFEMQRRFSSPMQSVEQANLKDELARLKSQLVLMEQTHAENHPDVKMIQSRMSKIQDLLWNEATLSEGDHAGKLLLNFEQGLRQELKVAKEHLASVPETALALQDLERSRSGAERRFESLREKLDNAERGLALVRLQHGNHLRVVDYPSVAEKPSWPNYQAVGIIGLGLSLLMAGAVVVALEGLYPAVRRSADLVKAMNRHAIVSIPLILNKRDRGRQTASRLLTGGLIAACFATLILVVLFGLHKKSSGETSIVQATPFLVNSMETL